MKGFVIDVAKCNGCYSCQIACKDEHCGADWSPYAKAQPDTGQFWIRIDEKTRGKVPVVRLSYTPVLCSHCADAPCMEACASDAFERRGDGLLLLSPEKCTGCESCIDACPTGSIFFNDDAGIAQKCTGCAHLLDNGWEEPRCCDVCPTGAIAYRELDENEVSGLVGLEVLPGLEVSGANARYLNLPKRFIAAAVVDFADDEVVIGAEATLRGADGADVAAVRTDSFGDFMFNQVEPGRYTVCIEKPGYSTLVCEADATEEDVVLGDLAFDKA